MTSRHICDNLRRSRYDGVFPIVEGLIVMGEENLKDIESWVGRMGEHPKAQTSIQIIFVSPEHTYGKFAVYDGTEASWTPVKEVETAPDWSLAGVPRLMFILVLSLLVMTMLPSVAWSVQVSFQ